MGEIIIMGFIVIILYSVFIWSFFYPEESLLFLSRWQYEEEPNFSGLAIRLNKYLSLFFIFLISLFLVSSIIDNYLIIWLLILGLLGYLIIAVYKILSK